MYKELSKGYYGLQSTILTLAFMALCRIKNPEQLKQHAVGELGALIGLDRMPEARCLRQKIQQIVTDKWDEKLFKPHPIEEIGNTVTVLLYEQQVTLGGHSFREVRSLSESGHQTAIITTNPQITIAQIASRMFSRWSQENFFKYLIADYDFDKIIQYGTETIDETSKIVNPEYRKITHKIKK